MRVDRSGPGARALSDPRAACLGLSPLKGWPMRCFGLFVFLGLTNAVLGWTGTMESASAQPTTLRKPLAQERLVMPLFPANWVEVYRETGPIEIVEYVPNGQSATTWQDKITLQVYHDMDDLPLDAIQRRSQGQNRNRCTGVIEGPLQSGLNNGYPSAFWTLGCRYLNDGGAGEMGVGETQYTKAIQGNTALYVLNRIWRTPAFGEDGPAIDANAINDGIAFLTTSIVCVPDSADHPCGAN